jgi:pheromone shutdown protein TraB
MITLVGVGHVFELKKQVRGIIMSRKPEVVYRKVMATMSFEEKMKMIIGSMSGLFVRKKRIDKELKKFEVNEKEYLDTFEKQFPSIKKVLVDDRNVHMSNAVREIKKDYRDVVVVIGDGHIEGMRRLLDDLKPEVIRLSELRDHPDSTYWDGSQDGQDDEGNVSVSYSFEVKE